VQCGSYRTPNDKLSCFLVIKRVGPVVVRSARPASFHGCIEPFSTARRGLFSLKTVLSLSAVPLGERHRSSEFSRPFYRRSNFGPFPLSPPDLCITTVNISTSFLNRAQRSRRVYRFNSVQLLYDKRELPGGSLSGLWRLAVSLIHSWLSAPARGAIRISGR